VVELEPIRREEAVKKMKPRGKYIEKAEKWLRQFLEGYEKEKVDAQRLLFSNPEYSNATIKSYYKSLHYLIEKKKLPVTVILDMANREIDLLYGESEE